VRAFLPRDQDKPDDGFYGRQVADVGWQTAEKTAMGKEHSWIRAGLLIDGGKLTMVRIGSSGGWESSGVVCACLPPKVIVSTFLFEFMGNTTVELLGIYPSSSPFTYANVEETGKLSAWAAWPPVRDSQEL